MVPNISVQNQTNSKHVNSLQKQAINLEDHGFDYIEKDRDKIGKS
jgi:hypothetical protein